MQAEFDPGAAAFAVIVFMLTNGYRLPEELHLATQKGQNEESH